MSSPCHTLKWQLSCGSREAHAFECGLCRDCSDGDSDLSSTSKFVRLCCSCVLHYSCLIAYIRSKLGDRQSISLQGIACPYGCECKSFKTLEAAGDQTELYITVDDLDSIVDYGMSHPELTQYLDKNDCKELTHEEISGLREWIEERASKRQKPDKIFTDSDYDMFVLSSTKACPNCGYRSTHYQGHQCHHVKCPNCQVGYCYKCLSSDVQNKRDRGADSACQCDRGYWVSFCSPIISASDIKSYIAINAGGIPFDKRCGCVICGDCRNGLPCSYCAGDCCVCKGYVNAAPNEVIDTSRADKKWVAEGPALPAVGYFSLWDCCRHGYVDQLETMLQEASFTTEDLNRSDQDGRTGLHLACDAGHTEVIRLLLAHPSIDLSCKSRRESPLLTAVINGNVHVVNLLLQHPAILTTDSFFAACHPHRLDILRMLLEHRLHHGTSSEILNMKLLLHRCRFHHYNEVLDLLVNHEGTYSNSNDVDEQSIWLKFYNSCAKGHVEIVTSLLNDNALALDINRRDTTNGWSPFYVACKYGRKDVVNLLLHRSDLDVNALYDDSKSILHVACEEGNTAIVHLLLCCPQVDVNLEMPCGVTPLNLACCKTSFAVVRLLLKHPLTDVTKEAYDGWTPLINAINIGCIDIINLLLQHPNIDPNQCDYNDDFTPLHHSIMRNRIDIFKALLHHEKIDVNKADVVGETCIYRACHSHLQCRVMFIQSLLANHNIDVNKKTLMGYAPLHLVGKNQQDVFRLLLAHQDIDVNIRDNDGCTALMKALMKNEVDLIRQLLDHPRIDVTVAANDGRTAVTIAEKSKMEVLDEILAHLDEGSQAVYKRRSSLWDCYRHGYVDQLETMLQEASFTTEDLNRSDQDGRTGLHLACDAGHTEVIRLLLAHPSISVGGLPLVSACDGGHTEVVRLLLAHPSINVNRTCRYNNSDDTTALSTACDRGDTEIVSLLLDFPGIDVNRACKYETTPLTRACCSGHTEVVRLLLAYPSINVGTIALNCACCNGQTEVVRLLLAHPGMNVNQAYSDDTTPLSTACDFGHTEVVKLLLAHPSIDVNYHIYNAPLSCACDGGHTEVVSLLLAHPGIDVTKALNSACDRGDTEVVSLLLAHPGIDINQGNE